MWLLRTSWLVIFLLTSIDCLAELGVNITSGQSLRYMLRGCPALRNCCWDRKSGSLDRLWSALVLIGMRARMNMLVRITILVIRIVLLARPPVLLLCLIWLHHVGLLSLLEINISSRVH